MCGTCGCAEGAKIRVLGALANASTHAHGNAGYSHADPDTERAHVHAAADSAHERGRTVVLQQKVLAKNDRIARRNRDWLRARGILAVNLMSSPGAGKTTLLERTAAELAAELGGELAISVIEGDLQTSLDADRIRAAGWRVVQINTGAGCHLDAGMVAEGLTALDPPAGSVVIIENVGNLVCPALFDLGEHSRVVMTAVTEGADKPAKYPQMFRAADLVLLNKVDLLPYVDFDTARHAADLSKITPNAEVLPLSATTGAGLAEWCPWLRQRAHA